MYLMRFLCFVCLWWIVWFLFVFKDLFIYVIMLIILYIYCVFLFFLSVVTLAGPDIQVMFFDVPHHLQGDVGAEMVGAEEGAQMRVFDRVTGP